MPDKKGFHNSNQKVITNRVTGPGADDAHPILENKTKTGSDRQEKLDQPLLIWNKTFNILEL